MSSSLICMDSSIVVIYHELFFQIVRNKHCNISELSTTLSRGDDVYFDDAQHRRKCTASFHLHGHRLRIVPLHGVAVEKYFPIPYRSHHRAVMHHVVAPLGTERRDPIVVSLLAALLQ